MRWRKTMRVSCEGKYSSELHNVSMLYNSEIMIIFSELRDEVKYYRTALQP